MAKPKKDTKQARRAHPYALAYPINEAASVVGVSRSLIYDLMAEGKLQSIKLKGKRLIPRAALEQLLTEAGE